MRTRLIAGVAVAAVVAAGAVAVVDPFSGPSASGGGFDNGAPTATAKVMRQDLSSQTQVSATLGYADASVIAVPTGTAPASVEQAQQTAASAQSALDSARATLADDESALTQARSTLAATQARVRVDCAGSNATATACATEAQAVAGDQQAVTAAVAKVAADRRAVASADASSAAAQRTLGEARSSATSFGQTSVYTELPVVGQVIRPGETVYAIGGAPVVLLRGRTTPWRAFAAGMSPGRDVAELNANLGLTGDAFTSSTSAAISAFQRAHGLAETGELLLGSVVFEPGAVRVTSVTPTVGAPVQAGAVLNVTSTEREVTIDLDASQQSTIKVGDPVEITLPDNTTTPGHVTFVGTVATTPPDSGNGSSSPTVEVDVRPDRPKETGRLDQAPVDVSITTDTVRGVLVVPVNALLALAGGGYAVEDVAADGTHRLLRVQLGLFDDAQGLVEVTGSALREGQRVVVPA